jgi:2'-5' RNA ligase
MHNFFLGIALPEKLEAEVEEWRRRFRAPRTRPHITLIPPFEWKHEYQSLLRIIEDVESRHEPFLISGEGLGNFGKAVLFVNVGLSSELQSFQEDLAETLAKYGIPREKRPYHPHITLATRLRPRDFEEYLKQLNGFSPSYEFTFSGTAVFKLVTEGRIKRWELQRKP